MKDTKVTQEALAERMDVTQGAIAHWLSGRREINLNDFFKLCAKAQADPKTVLFGSQPSAAEVLARLSHAIERNPELVAAESDTPIELLQLPDAVRTRLPRGGGSSTRRKTRSER